MVHFLVSGCLAYIIMGVYNCFDPTSKVTDTFRFNFNFSDSLLVGFTCDFEKLKGYG